MREVNTSNCLAIFDLDKTLLDEDCEYLWCEFLWKNGHVNAGYMQSIQEYFASYDAGNLDFTEYERFLLSSLVALPQEKLRELQSAFLHELQAHFRPWMLERIEFHRAQGHGLLLATASNSLLVLPIAQSLNIPNVLCTVAEMKGGVPTGELVTAPLFQEEKARRINSWAQMNSLSLAGSWCYSDSRNDLPMLMLAENPVAVTPDETLREQAIKNGWLILES
jgi:HAD superfamily hydrolase (TIGR01490 family)